jgi:hypothetical protein
MTGVFLMSLSLLKVGILGYVGKGASSSVGQLREELPGISFFLAFLGLMVCLLQMGALQWFHQMGCL